jgi:hypothetical protein
MTENTYFVFQDILSGQYYSLKDDNTITTYEKNIELEIDKKEGLFFDIIGMSSSEDIKFYLKNTINQFLLNQKYIKQSFDDNNITYIIYKDDNSLLTIRQLINEKKKILYIIEFENNEKNLSNLLHISKETLKKIQDKSNLNSIYEQFNIGKVLE